MNIGQAIIEALESLNSNKPRSALTILGIVIGVGAVIAMLSIGSGAQSAITGSISGIGSNLLFVFRGNLSANVQVVKPLTFEDSQALLDQFQAPSVQDVAPVINGTVSIVYGTEKTSTTVYGVTPSYQPVRYYALSEGSFITDEHNLGQASVVLLGPDVANKLFGRATGLVGESIRIEGVPFRVIGVLETKGGGSFGSEDNVVLVPFNTAQLKLLHRTQDHVDLIYVQAVSSNAVQAASDEVAQILRTRHRTKIGEDDFTIFSQSDFVSTAQTITNVLTISWAASPGSPYSWGYRYHEHHAGIGHRTDAGDWPAKSAGSAQARHPHPVPGRIFSSQPAGWVGGYRPGLDDRLRGWAHRSCQQHPAHPCGRY